MVSQVVDIFNLACSQFTRSSILSVNEKSREAELCSLWYDPTLKSVLRAAPWNFATAVKRLDLLATRDFNLAWASADPMPEWTYEYQLPSDLIRPRYLTSYGRFDLGTRGSTSVLYTNEPLATLVYTKEQPLIHLWDDSFVTAMARALGANVVLGLTGKVGKAKNELEMANQLIGQARADTSNEKEVAMYDSTPSWFAVRGLSMNPLQPQYIFPNGPLLSLPNVG